MRIGVNTLFLIPGVVGGTETYTREMLRAMTRLFPQDEFILFCNRENYGTFDSTANLREIPCRVRATNRPWRILYEQTALLRKIGKESIDVLWSAGDTMPYLLRKLPTVTTVYDLQSFRFPANFSWHYLLAVRATFRLTLRRATRIMTISQSVAEEIGKRFQLDRARFRAVPLGVSPRMFETMPEKVRMERLRRLGIQKPYVLAVSNSYPHKNLGRLVRAFGQVAEKVNCPLVIVGPERRGEGEVTQTRTALPDSRLVQRIQRVAADDLRALYQSCKLFVLPSLYEGFGLPVLEALASGAPVACSDIPVFREIAGEAAEYFDPQSETKIAETISRLIADRARLEQLSAQGVLRAKEFTWDRAATLTMQALREVAPTGSDTL